MGKSVHYWDWSVTDGRNTRVGDIVSYALGLVGVNQIYFLLGVVVYNVELGLKVYDVGIKYYYIVSAGWGTYEIYLGHTKLISCSLDF